VIDIVRGTTPRVRAEQETYRYINLHRRVAEAYTGEQLRMAAQVFRYPVELVKIPNGTETLHYQFKQHYGTTEVIDKKTGANVTDIDALVAIAEDNKKGTDPRIWHPFLVEVKLSEFGCCNGTDQPEIFSSNLTKLVRDPYSMKGIAPVLEYFRQLYDKGEIDNKPDDVGMMIAMPPDKFDITKNGSQKKFVEGGGNILRFPRSLKDYSQMIYGWFTGLDIKVA